MAVSAASVLGASARSRASTSTAGQYFHAPASAAKSRTITIRATYVHREENLARCGDPAIAIHGEPATGDDAVHVRMKDELTGPGVQHGRER